MPGLFKVLKPTRTGVVLESLDDIKKRVMAQTRHKISFLHEISIFTNTVESNVVLEKVFADIYAKYNTKLTIDHKTATNDELKAFLGEIVPDFDQDKVYISDIKKLVSWYKIIARELKPIKEEAEDKNKKKATPKKEGDKAKKATVKKKPVAARKAKPAPMKKVAGTKKNG